MRMMMRSDLGTKRTSESWEREDDGHDFRWSFFFVLPFSLISSTKGRFSLSVFSPLSKAGSLHLSIVYVLVTHVLLLSSLATTLTSPFPWMQEIISSGSWSHLTSTLSSFSFFFWFQFREGECNSMSECVCVFHEYSSSIISFFTKERKVWKIRFLSLAEGKKKRDDVFVKEKPKGRQKGRKGWSNRENLKHSGEDGEDGEDGSWKEWL